MVNVDLQERGEILMKEEKKTLKDQYLTVFVHGEDTNYYQNKPIINYGFILKIETQTF